MSYITISIHTVAALVASLSLALIVAFTIRQITAKRSQSSIKAELAQKDNFAMGISYAAWLFTSVVVIGYTVDRIPEKHTLSEMSDLLLPLLWVFTSFAFIHIGRVIHAHFIINRFNEDKAILQKNVCAALVESGAIISNGVIVVALYQWLSPDSVYDYILMFIAFLFCQVVLTLQSRWHEYTFAKANQGERLQRSFKFDNTAIGLRYASRTVAGSFALYAGLNLATYNPNLFIDNFFSLAINCITLLIMHLGLCTLFTRIALPRINAENEIDQQDNVGIACIELAINLSLGLLLVRILA